MAVVAMTALNYAESSDVKFEAHAHADVCFLQAEEKDGTDTRKSQIFNVLGHAEFVFSTDNATLMFQNDLNQLTTTSFSGLTSADADNSGDALKSAATLLSRDNNKILLDLTVYQDESQTYSVSAKAGNVVKGYSHVAARETSSLGYGASVSGDNWGISVVSNTSLGTVETDDDGVSYEKDRGDFDFALSGHYKGIYKGLDVAGTFIESRHFAELSVRYDLKSLTSFDSSVSVFGVSNTDASDDNYAFGGALSVDYPFAKDSSAKIEVSYTLQQPNTVGTTTNGFSMQTPNRHKARVSGSDVADFATSQPDENLTTLVVSASANLIGHNFEAFYGSSKLNNEEVTLMGLCWHLSA